MGTNFWKNRGLHEHDKDSIFAPLSEYVNNTTFLKSLFETLFLWGKFEIQSPFQHFGIGQED